MLIIGVIVFLAIIIGVIIYSANAEGKKPKTEQKYNKD